MVTNLLVRAVNAPKAVTVAPGWFVESGSCGLDNTNCNARGRRSTTPLSIIVSVKFVVVTPSGKMMVLVPKLPKSTPAIAVVSGSVKSTLKSTRTTPLVPPKRWRLTTRLVAFSKTAVPPLANRITESSSTIVTTALAIAPAVPGAETPRFTWNVSSPSGMASPTILMPKLVEICPSAKVMTLLVVR